MTSPVLITAVGAVAAITSLVVYLRSYRLSWADWRAQFPEPPDVHSRPGPRFHPIPVTIELGGREVASTGWGVSVTDLGLLLRRPFLRAGNPGLWIPWAAVETVEAKSSVLGSQPGQATSWVVLALTGGRGAVTLDDPAGEAAHGHWRVYRAHARPATA